jgi:hypothetical protein
MLPLREAQDDDLFRGAKNDSNRLADGARDRVSSFALFRK